MSHLDRAYDIAKRSPDAQHVFRVADGFEGEEQLVALLHDALEDGVMEIRELRDFPQRVFDAVVHLTRLDGERYVAYVQRVRDAPGAAGGLARAVKRRDVEDNLARSTAAGTESRVRRYRMAQEILS
jgi:hypothetical protein